MAPKYEFKLKLLFKVTYQGWLYIVVMGKYSKEACNGGQQFPPSFSAA